MPNGGGASLDAIADFEGEFAQFQMKSRRMVEIRQHYVSKPGG
jgi:hypothetical protein